MEVQQQADVRTEREREMDRERWTERERKMDREIEGERQREIYCSVP